MRYENKSMMKADDVIIVTGLPRSGTSLIMQILDTARIEIITDGIRGSDEDNPKGYFEFEKVKSLPDESSWLEEAGSKAVKVVGELLKGLPKAYHYKVIFMMRDIGEIIRSQDKMMERRGEPRSDIPEAEMEEILRRYLRMLKLHVNGREEMDVLYVSYNDLLEDPEAEIDEVAQFLDIEIDRNEMKKVIDRKLYRNRM